MCTAWPYAELGRWSHTRGSEPQKAAGSWSPTAVCMCVSVRVRAYMRGARMCEEVLSMSRAWDWRRSRDLVCMCHYLCVCVITCVYVRQSACLWKWAKQGSRATDHQWMYIHIHIYMCMYTHTYIQNIFRCISRGEGVCARVFEGVKVHVR